MKTPKTIALGAVLKNERPYLLEWLAYHSLLGFNQFYLIDDHSSDGSYELLKCLQRKLPVKVKKGRGDKGRRKRECRSFENYRLILKKAQKDEVDYLAYLDLDEFLASTDEKGSLENELGELFSSREVSAVGLNWCCFGSSGHFMKQPGLVIENFSRHGEKSLLFHHHYKSIVRPTRVSGLWNTHQFKLCSGFYIHGDGSPLKPHPEHPYGLSEKVCWKGFRVNHYVVKSLEEFFRYKARRGCGESDGKIKGEDYFRHHDRNEVVQPFPVEVIEAIKSQIRAWGFDPDRETPSLATGKWWNYLIPRGFRSRMG